MDDSLNRIATIRLISKLRAMITDASCETIDSHEIDHEEIRSTLLSVVSKFPVANRHSIDSYNIWQPTKFKIDYGRYHHKIILCDDFGHTHSIKRKFHSRRLVRVAAKIALRQRSLFIDFKYYPTTPIDYVKMNFVVNRSEDPHEV